MTWLCWTDNGVIFLNIDIITILRGIHGSCFEMAGDGLVALVKSSGLAFGASDEGAKSTSRIDCPRPSLMKKCVLHN
jgi:hypothetical protein